MARRTETARPTNRFVILCVGALLGAVWGTIMWGLFELFGQDSGLRGWGYLAITMAMIGAGVAAIFGANAARQRGERVTPRLRSGRRGRGR
jgi:hypothetical protein